MNNVTLAIIAIKLNYSVLEVVGNMSNAIEDSIVMIILVDKDVQLMKCVLMECTVTQTSNALKVAIKKSIVLVRIIVEIINAF